MDTGFADPNIFGEIGIAKPIIAPARRNTTPLTASDAARLAAQKSARRKVTIPLGEDGVNHNTEQKSVLARIAQTIGPQANRPLQERSLQANANNNYQARPPHIRTGTPPPQNYSNQQPNAQYKDGYPTERRPARRRR